MISPPFDPAAFAEIPSPALAVYPSAARGNLELAIRIAGNAEALRPHVKTHKTAELCRLQADLGILSCKAATIAEAETAAEGGVREVLLAYPAVGPTLARLAALRRRWRSTRFQAVFEDAAGAAALAALAEVQARAGLPPLEAWLDLDCGQGRTGCAPAGAAALLAAASKLPGLAVRGVHAYDGHVHDPDPDVRAASVEATRTLLAGIVADAAAAGAGPVDLVLGGTPTFALHLSAHRGRPLAGVRSVQASPGTFVLQDANYAAWYPDLPFAAAAFVLARAVRVDAARRRATLDAGVKAIAADPAGQRGFLAAAPAGIDAGAARPLGHSEEHWVWEFPAGAVPEPGSLFLIQPAHVCPTVALHAEAVLVSGEGRPDGRWRVAARDRRLSI